jgi:hypothetical protein
MGRSKRMTPNMVFKTWDASDMVLLKERSRTEQFEVIDGRVREIERINRTVFAELGILALYVQEQHLWDEGFGLDGKPLRSFEQWIQESCPYSAAYAKEAKSKIKIFRDSGINLDLIADVPQCNMQVLSMLPPAVLREEPDVIRDAKLLEEKAYREKMAREYPEAHIDPKKKMLQYFSPLVDEALALAMKKWDCSRTAATEAVFAEWLVLNREESDSGHDRTSVREAGQAATV